MKLLRKYVEKPWGRTQIPARFKNVPRARIGEVWFVGSDELPLLVKYILTSEKLSVQVHPDDDQARLRGLRSGKSECWYVVGAEPGATIGVGLRRHVSEDELRSAALDNSIEQLIDWRPVKAGDTFDVRPGTIHAIGGGVSLVEFQQNADVTFRLYDYGRPRELHLDDALGVADRASFPEDRFRHVAAADDIVVVDGPHLKLAHVHADRFQDRRRWIVPLEGEICAGGVTAVAGDCLLAAAGEQVEVRNARLLIAAAA